MDCFQDTFKIVIHVRIGDAHDQVPAPFQLCGSHGIARHFVRRRVRSSVNLNDKLSCQGNEIDNISINAVLAAELPSREFSILQRMPKPRFGIRL